MNDFTTFNNFFDHIYIITLRRATERQDLIKTSLAGLNYEFFFGVDKEGQTISNMIRQGIYDETLAKENHRYHKAFSIGQVCCAWSHRKVYEDVLINGYSKVLILEDDVIATSDLMKTCAAVLNELPVTWELLYLDYSKNEVSNKLKQSWYHIQRALGQLSWTHTTIDHLYPKINSEHLATAGFHDFTSAYAITSAAAEKLLQLQTPLSYLADNLLATACTTKLVEGYISRPKIFSQLSQGSDKSTGSFVDD
ncbi:MAG: glycosyltransferase family 25 protein [Ferruginibacter sp.]